MKLPSFGTVFLSAFGLLSAFANATPLGHQNVKRATQVNLIGHTYSNNVLSGTINVSFHLTMPEDTANSRRSKTLLITRL